MMIMTTDRLHAISLGINSLTTTCFVQSLNVHERDRVTLEGGPHDAKSCRSRSLAPQPSTIRSRASPRVWRFLSSSHHHLTLPSYTFTSNKPFSSYNTLFFAMVTGTMAANIGRSNSKSSPPKTTCASTSYVDTVSSNSSAFY
jgi:hypothetical protein